MKLTEKRCVPCEGGMPAFTPEQVKTYHAEAQGWQVIQNKRIAKEFTFKNFKDAMEFINTVADIAESENHHPDICIFYNRVKLELSTHAINGLSENDFILAAKIDELPADLKSQ